MDRTYEIICKATGKAVFTTTDLDAAVNAAINLNNGLPAYSKNITHYIRSTASEKPKIPPSN